MGRPERLGWSAALRAGLATMFLLACVLVAPNAGAAPRYAAIVIDASTGSVLHENGADARVFPASLTKMMTLYLLFEAVEEGRIGMTDRIRFSARAAAQPPSKLGLGAGNSLTVRQAILALVVRSANDVAYAVGETLGGSEAGFARLMTARAQRLGMHSTTFRNASGLPNSAQTTTVRDMVLLARALYRDFPQHYHFFATTSVTINGTTHRGHNRLMARYAGMDGMKTGYIRASGFNLAASANRNGRRLFAVVVGGRSAQTRDDQMARLLDAAFDTPNPIPAVVAKPLLMVRAPEAAPASALALAAAPDPNPDPIIWATGDAPTPEMRPDIGSGQDDGADGPISGQFVGSIAGTLQHEVPFARSEGLWAVQVGAFSAVSSAEKALMDVQRKVPGLLSNAAPSVTERAVNGRTLYRARLHGFTEEEARRACHELERSGTACLTTAH